MMLPMKTMTDFVIQVGADNVQHSGKTYLAHVIGVYRLMKSWAEEDEMCRAAIFHSIYGTEGFQDFTLPLDRREEVCALIGERAEQLSYANRVCALIGERAEQLSYANSAMNRASFYGQVKNDQDDYQIKDRITGGTIDLTARAFEDLIRLHLCDFLEQVERDKGWQYERETMKAMSNRLGGIALDTYQSVFTRESQVV